MGSFGKDENHSFYIFDMRTKSIHWEQSTKEGNEENQYLLDVCFSPDKDSYELCLVGIEKIIFANFQSRAKNPKVNKATKNEKIYTTCCYIDKNICLIGNNLGKYMFM